MIVEITPATEADIVEMAPHVRPADRAEIWASLLQLPSQVLCDAIKVSSEAWTGRIDGEIVCMYGVGTTGILTPDHGRPWLIATSKLDDRAVGIAFARRNRAWLRGVLCRYRMLSNYCDARNVVALKWLRWCGFRFTGTVAMGPYLLPFVRFEMKSED